MDQVPLPFVCGQDHTFCEGDDKDINIKCPSEQLRKRPFTMHVVVNAGIGNKKQGWVDLVAKGTGKRIRKCEKQSWDKKINMYWQKNAWVDTPVMLELAKKFVRKKNEVHGKDKWVLLYCDNLKAHVAPDVKRIFGDNKVLLCFLPPGTTNFTQAIDAGHGRSLRTAIGHSLDKWLMDSDNMERWEGTMTAGERRILMTKLVGSANRVVMSDDNDEMRVGCFERTGMLITMLVVDDYDRKNKVQGMKDGSLNIPKMRDLLDDAKNDVTEALDEEQATLERKRSKV